MPPSTEQLLALLIDGVERELPRAVALRRALHGRPELAREEHWTAEAVAEQLPVRASVAAGTGRVAVIGEPSRPLVGVRAELDGLPVREQTGAPFSATGETMHACGHDVHMAALVALSRAVHELCDQLPVRLLAIFQPSEEVQPSGAAELADGVLAELAPAAVVGAHVHPELAWGTIALDRGVVNASYDSIVITVEGRPSHGAYPHQGRDPILALSQVIVALHAQVGRRIDPMAPATLTVGAIEAGTAENVIPARALARAALRAHSPADRLALRELVQEVVGGVAGACGCEGSVTVSPSEPALENDPGIVAGARALLAQAGLRAAPEWRSCGSDDFAFFGALGPVAMGFVGLDGAPGFLSRPLHHPELLPPEQAVGTVARAMAVLLLAAVPGA